MKPALRYGSLLLLVFAVLDLSSAMLAEPVPLQRAVQMALTRSPVAAAAGADEQRAYQSYREIRNQYIPQFSIGSGLGKAWGYPLSLEGSAPAIFNVNTQSTVYNPAIRDFLRAAHTDWQASAAQGADQRNQLIQDTVLSYAELVKWMDSLERLRQEQTDASKMQQVVDARIQEGVDSPSESNRAKLAVARVRLRLSQALGAIDVLRKRLSNLTGIPADSIDAVRDSVPTLPEMPKDDLADRVATNDPAVQAADAQAAAQKYRARGEHRALWPTADFAGQYALLSPTLTDYQQFFQPGSFQRQNGTVGLVLRLNFLNESQRARAHAADAAAIRAKADADSARNKMSEEALRLQRSVEQLSAAQQVADLEYQVAQSSFDALKVRLDAGTANFHEVEDAREQANERYNGLLDASFELQRARIALLRVTGELAKWVSGQK
jgi:outer membrane protein TolC